MKSSRLLLFSLLLITSLFAEDKPARHTLCGNVLTKDGKPFTKVFVQLYRPGESSARLSSAPYIPAMPDSQGHFKFERYLPSGTYWIAVCPRLANRTTHLTCTAHVTKVVLNDTPSAKGACDATIVLAADENGLIVDKTR